MKPRAPDFLCIGAAKAGTTWLHGALGACPGYWMPPVKELGFFLHRNWRARDERFKASLDADIVTDEAYRSWLRHYVFGEPKDQNWYYTLFAGAGERITGDISPGYARIRNVPPVKEIVPDASILMIVRNPVDRDLSHALHHAFRRAFGATPKTEAFIEHLADAHGIGGTRETRRAEVLRRYGLEWTPAIDVTQLLDAYNRVSGSALHLDDLPKRLGIAVTVDDVRKLLDEPAMRREQEQARTIRHWRKVFGDKVHVYLYDDLVADPVKFLADVTAALGRPSRPDDLKVLELRSNPGIYGVDGIEALREELRERCAEEIRQLRAIFGDRIAHWTRHG